MVQAALRAEPPELMVVFDGQSFNRTPPWEGDENGRSYPWHLLHGPGWGVADRPSGGIAHAVPAVSGNAWSTLLTTVATRTHPLANAATITALVLCGGTTSVNNGDSAATIYANMVDYAVGCRTAGFDYIVACDILGSGSFAGGEITAWADANTLILADASEAFDAVVNTHGAFEAEWGASYWESDPPMFGFDQTHPVGDGTIVLAEAVAAVLWPLLAS
jgi:hypothetical protein